MTRLSTLVLLPVLALLAVACGGGGGGDDAPVDPGAPGTLRALALEGEAAPDAGAGTFDVFPTFPVLSAGNGGWAAFVAPIAGGSVDSVVYVALPGASATLVRVFAEGDAVLAGTARFIQDFAGVWMCADGTVFALANLTGGMGTEDFALVAVDVDAGGSLSNLRTLLVDEGDISAVVAAGVLADIDPTTLVKDADERLWMLVVDGNGGGTHLVSIEGDGTGLARRASPGDPLDAPADTVQSIDAFGVSAEGTWYGYAVTETGGARRVILRDRAGSLPQQAQRDSDPLPNAGTVADAWKRGRIHVYEDASLAWVCKGSASGADDVYMLFQLNAGIQFTEMARVGQTAPDTGMGTFSSIDTLNAAPSPQRVLFNAGVSGGTLGATNATFRVDGIAPLTVRGDTADVVFSQGSVEPANYINLRQTNQPYDEVSSNGGMIYANTWLTTSAVWWVTRNGVLNNTNAIAAQGGPAPGGDTFGSFTGGVGMTTANGVVLFRAPVTNAGTGIFRQGP